MILNEWITWKGTQYDYAVTYIENLKYFLYLLSTNIQKYG